MNHKLTVNYNNKPAYDIVIDGTFQHFVASIETLNMQQRRFLIVSDHNVSKYYLKECKALLQGVAKEVKTFLFPAGEQSKNLDTVNACYEQLIESGFDRNDVLVALGGGVVGDLTGFVAATYLRGVRFIQIPTSLLAMVDSSIGGKTGVDFKAYKNMVGAFHQPKLVYMNLSTLNTLPQEEYLSGISEIIKHGLIKDINYYQWLKHHVTMIKAKDQDTLKNMILNSCQIKKEVVERDPKEEGERALLNFGHTVGHSVEKLMNLTLLHGECVSIGMVAAAFLSYKKNFISKPEVQDIIDTLKSFDQPIKISGLTKEEIYEVTKHDKKMDSHKIKFILLRQIGHGTIDSSITKEELIEAIEFIQSETNRNVEGL